ncbi:hypothetical protein [Streptomyces griseus]
MGSPSPKATAKTRRRNLLVGAVLFALASPPAHSWASGARS